MKATAVIYLGRVPFFSCLYNFREGLKVLRRPVFFFLFSRTPPPPRPRPPCSRFIHRVINPFPSWSSLCRRTVCPIQTFSCRILQTLRSMRSARSPPCFSPALFHRQAPALSPFAGRGEPHPTRSASLSSLGPAWDDHPPNPQTHQSPSSMLLVKQHSLIFSSLRSKEAPKFYPGSWSHPLPLLSRQSRVSLSLRLKLSPGHLLVISLFFLDRNFFTESAESRIHCAVFWDFSTRTEHMRFLYPLFSFSSDLCTVARSLPRSFFLLSIGKIASPLPFPMPQQSLSSAISGNTILDPGCLPARFPPKSDHMPRCFSITALTSLRLPLEMFWRFFARLIAIYSFHFGWAHPLTDDKAL